jgi:hypothetical protein
MFVRSFTALAAMFVLTLTLAATAAMATDEPAPTPQPQSQPTQCVDKTRPLSHLNVSWRRGFRSGVIRGIAIDQGCGASGAGKLRRVQVAIARKVGKRCRHLLPSGRLGRATACTHVWLNAKGTSTWSFRLRHHLPSGKYLVATRAIDAAGNVEARSKR